MFPTRNYKKKKKRENLQSNTMIWIYLNSFPVSLNGAALVILEDQYAIKRLEDAKPVLTKGTQKHMSRHTELKHWIKGNTVW